MGLDLNITIKDVEVHRVSVPFAKPFIIASGAYLPTADYVIVVVSSDAGLEGIGEASPMPAFSEEDQDGVVRVIEGRLASVVKGRPLFSLERILEEMESVAPDSPFARTGVEMALQDLMAKTLGVPLYALLGGLYRERIELAWPIGIGDEEEVVKEAEEAVKRGFGTIKLKVGRDVRKDIERVRKVRESLGEAVKIRIDANQGYSVEEALRVAKALAPLDIQLFEQPVQKHDLEGLKRVSEASPIPIAADESCYGPRDAILLASAKAARVVNIKIMKAGGLKRAKQIASICEASSLPNVLGSMLELGIGTAAGVHFAASTRNLAFAAEVVGPLFLEGDVIKRPLPYQGGILQPPKTPGLGVELNSGALERYSS